MIRTWCLLMAVLVALPALAQDRKADAKRGGKFDTAKLKGTYTIVKGERHGKALPESDFKGSVVTFTEDKIYGTDRDKKEFFGATYKLDASRTPVVIHMTSTSPKKGEKADGVIEQDGDTVRICYALPGGMAPTSFKAEEKQQYFVLKRTKAEPSGAR